MTAQGHARAQYRRAIEHKNLMGAEMLLREMGAVDLLEALDYVALLAELRPAKAPHAAVRWHGRLEAEAPMLNLPLGADFASRVSITPATEGTKVVGRRPGTRGLGNSAGRVSGF